MQASTHLPAQFEQDQVKEALVSVDIFIPKRGLANELIEEVHEKSLAKTYEKPAVTSNIHIDKVCVKKQIETRHVQKGDNDAGSVKKKNEHPKVQNTVAHIEHEKEDVGKKEKKNEHQKEKRHVQKGDNDAGSVKKKNEHPKVQNTVAHIEHEKEDVGKKEKKNEHPKVQNTVARIEHEKKGGTKTGSSIPQVLVFILGFLLNNRLISLRLWSDTDGERHLQNTVVGFGAKHNNVSLMKGLVSFGKEI